MERMRFSFLFSQTAEDHITNNINQSQKVFQFALCIRAFVCLFVCQSLHMYKLVAYIQTYNRLLIFCCSKSPGLLGISVFSLPI